MLRKLTIALAAVATIGAAALAPTAASAGWKGHHGHHGHFHFKSWGWHAPVYAHGYGYGCWRKKWVKGYYGWRLVRVNVCY